MIGSSIDDNSFRGLAQHWVPTVDLFAHYSNAECAKFYSLGDAPRIRAGLGTRDRLVLSNHLCSTENQALLHVCHSSSAGLDISILLASALSR